MFGIPRVLVSKLKPVAVIVVGIACNVEVRVGTDDRVDILNVARHEQFIVDL